MPRLVLRPEAEADVFTAVAWYEGERTGLGDAFATRLDATLRRVADTPLMFAIVTPPVRRALVGRFPFGVYFVVESTEIVRVLAVIHLHRSAESWQSRL